MSMYGMTIKPMMMKVGSTTPACHGSKNTSISCRPRKYQGALDGLGVLVGFAGSSIGASTVMLHTNRTRSRMQPEMNSARTRYGQVWTLSGRSAAAIARARPDWTFTSSWSAIGAPGEMFSAMVEVPRGLQRAGDAAVLPDAPEVQDHQDGGDDGDEDAVQDVEAQQGRRPHHRARRQESARIVARRHAQLRPEGPLVAEQGRRREEVDADHPVELARRLVAAGHEDPEHVQPDEDDHAVRRPAVHVAHDHSEGDVEIEVLDVPVRVLAGGPVVEHQHHAGHHGAQVEQEGQAARAPGVPVADAVPAHLAGVQVEPDVGRNLQHAVARGVRVAVAEDGPTEVVLGDDLVHPRLLLRLDVTRPRSSRPSFPPHTPITSTSALGSSHWPSSYR